MAEDLNDGEFWLPSQFLTDDDILKDYTTTNTNNNPHSNMLNHSPLDSSSPNSDLGSPVESVIGSTETESDEDDFITGLTHQMARSSLHKCWGMSGSPQSTLSASTLSAVNGGGCGCKQGSGRGSPNCGSETSPPAAATMSRNGSAWDLLYAAAGEVARMRMVEEEIGYYQKRGLTPIRNPSPPLSFPLNNRHHSYKQLQVTHFEQLKQQQQMMKQQSSVVWEQGKRSVLFNQNRGGRPLGLSPSAWPTLQQSKHHHQTSSGMRAVFLGSSGGPKRECAGTGVFLPRRLNNPSQTRNNSGCSTVLLPDRVVQALKLNLETMDAHPQLQPRYRGNISTNYDGAMKYQNDVQVGPQRHNMRPQAVTNNQEVVRLPQEWTY